MDSRSDSQLLSALFAIAGMVTKGSSDGMLQQAVRECFALRDHLTRDLLGIFKGSNKAASDLLCLLEVLNLVKEESHIEVKKRAIRAVQQWKRDCLKYNPLQLAVYDLMSEAILKSTVELEGKTTVLASLGDKSGQVVVFPQSRDVVLLDKRAMINVIDICIKNPNIDKAELLAISLFDAKDRRRLEDEKRKGISTTNSLKLIRDGYNGLPPPKIPPVLTYYPLTGSANTFRSPTEEESSLNQLHIGLDVLLKMNKKMDVMDKKIDSLQADVKILQANMSEIEISEIEESTARLLQALRSQFPEVQITCDTATREFEYDSSSAAATALETLSKRCLKDGEKQLQTREIPQMAEIACVCRMTIPSFGTHTPMYYYLGEIDRSRGLCSSAADYVHPSTEVYSASTKLLYKLIQLERGILAADSKVLGCAVISPSFRRMSEKAKADLLSVCLAQAPELHNLESMYDEGHLLLLSY